MLLKYKDVFLFYAFRPLRDACWAQTSCNYQHKDWILARNKLQTLMMLPWSLLARTWPGARAVTAQIMHASMKMI